MFVRKMLYISCNKICLLNTHRYFIKNYIIGIWEITFIRLNANCTHSKINENRNEVVDERCSEFEFGTGKHIFVFVYDFFVVKRRYNPGEHSTDYS